MDAGTAIAQQPLVPDPGLPIPIELDPAHATPVFGTAEPAGGLPADLRRRAYQRPTHDPMHWLLLLAADRAESAASLAKEARTPGQQALIPRHFLRQVTGHPKGSLALGAITASGLALVFLGRWISTRFDD